MNPAPATPRPLPLEGVRVLDFSRLLPGPWATQMLAEFGAEVIKVEQPVIGDPSRHNRPQLAKHSYYFNAMNAFKRSIALDLAKPAGRAIAHRLVRDADVAVESARAGGAAKLGLEPDVHERLRVAHADAAHRHDVRLDAELLQLIVDDRQQIAGARRQTARRASDVDRGGGCLGDILPRLDRACPACLEHMTW